MLTLAEALDAARSSVARRLRRDPLSVSLSPEPPATGDGPFVLGAAVAVIACCLGVSLLAAAGGTALLGLAGVALPAAALIGIGGWAAWYLLRRR